jgi:hypothetical protein
LFCSINVFYPNVNIKPSLPHMCVAPQCVLTFCDILGSWLARWHWCCRCTVSVPSWQTQTTVLTVSTSTRLPF